MSSNTEREEALYKLNVLESPSKELTKWEEDFVASLHDRLDTGKGLTEAQLDKLDDIYEEKK